MSLATRRLDALVLGASVSLGLVTACGDNLEPSQDGAGNEDAGSACVSTELDEFPEGPLGRPEDVALDGFECPDGGLADVDLNGRWSLVLPGGFSYQMPFIRESCEEGFEIEADLGPLLVHRDDTNVFVRTTFESEDFSFIFALRLCGIAGSSDELAVVAAQCFQGEDMKEPECFSDPGQMKRFGRPAGESDAQGLELVSEWSGGDKPWPVSTTTNVKVRDGVAFVSRLSYRGADVSDLRLVDVSNPERPRDLGSIGGEDDPGSDFNDVKVFTAKGGSYAILAGGSTPIVDARDPANPVIVSRLGEYSHSVFVREDAQGRPLAYLATTGSSPDLPIFDLSDPANPVLVERVPLPETAEEPVPVAIHDLYAEEDRLYLNAEGDGFVILDRDGADWVDGGRLVTNRYNHASWVGEIGGRRFAIMGDEGYDAHLQVVDVDPASTEFMTEIGSYQTRPEVSIHNMMLLGTRAYFTYYHDGVRVLDLADPTSPELAAYYHTWDVETGPPGPFASAIGLDVDPEAGLIYVADMERGLLILRETR